MSPTISPGERLTVDYGAYATAKPARWDVVVFRPPMLSNDLWFMRVIALPGETVTFATGDITLNSKALDLPSRLNRIKYLALDQIGLKSRIPSPYKVPADGYFVMGDNSTSAYDSRIWGRLAFTNIVGKIMNK